MLITSQKNTVFTIKAMWCWAWLTYCGLCIATPCGMAVCFRCACYTEEQESD